MQSRPKTAVPQPDGDGAQRKTAQLFANISTAFAKVSGRPFTLVAVLCIVLLWAVAGPLMRFSDTWQLIMNTVSSIITFVMVFLIQNTQARDSEGMHAKLDTLIAAVDAADNRYIGVERLPDQDIEELRARLGPHPLAEVDANRAGAEDPEAADNGKVRQS
jgi:low affinity Fe/Cu permease